MLGSDALRLQIVWLLDLKSRRPPVRRGLFLNSFRSSVLGMALSIAALSVTSAIFTGFERVLANGIASSLGHVTHFTNWHTEKELEEFVSAAPPGITRVVNFWTSQGLLVGPKGGRGVMLEGRKGTGVPVAPGDPVLLQLGTPLAEHLGVKTGDTVRILLPGILRGSVEARVESLLQYGMHDIDSRLAVVIDESLRPVMQARDPEAYANRPGDAHGLRFYLAPGGRAENVAWVERWLKTYEANLKEKRLLGETDFFRTWKDLQKNLLGSIGLDRTVLTILMGLLTLVATLNVAATLVVLFLERDREMAMLRAIGLSPRSLRWWITAQGLLMGALAAGLGLLLGRVLGWAMGYLPWAQLPADIYHIRQLPLAFDARDQLLAFVFGTLASGLTAWILGRPLARSPLLAPLGQRR